MPTRLNCPACEADNLFDGEDAGQPMRCVECGTTLVVPTGGSPPPLSLAAPPRSEPVGKRSGQTSSPSKESAGKGSGGKVQLIVGAVFVLLIGGAATGVYLVVQRVRNVLMAESDAITKRITVPGPSDSPANKAAIDLESAIAALSLREQNPPDDPAGQIALGDDWNQLADKAKGAERTRALRRMYVWYRLALPAADANKRLLIINRMNVAGVISESEDKTKNQFTLHAGTWRATYQTTNSICYSRDYKIEPDGRVVVTESTDGRSGRQGTLVRKNGITLLEWADGAPAEAASLHEDHLRLDPHKELSVPAVRPSAKAILLRPEVSGFKNPTGVELVFKPHQSSSGYHTAAFPGSPRSAVSKSPKIGSDFGMDTLRDDKEAIYSIRYITYPGDRSEAELLEANGLQSLTRQAISRKDLAFGAHPAAELTADKAPTGEPRNVRARLIAVGDKIYHLSVTSSLDQKIPEEMIAHFFKSFRLTAEPDSVFTELPAGTAPVWQASRSGEGNYIVEFPGKAADHATKSKATGQVTCTARLVDDKGTEYMIRSLSHPVGQAEAALLESVGEKELAKFATEKKAVKIGAHPGLEFTAAKTLDERPKNVRSRVFAVKNRIIQVSVVSNPDVKVPEETIARVFNSLKIMSEPEPKPVDKNVVRFPKEPLTDREGGWKEITIEDWNFSVEVPGVPTVNTVTFAKAIPGKIVWFKDQQETQFSTQVAQHPAGLTEVDLLEKLLGEDRFKSAMTKKPIKFGEHPGMEFTYEDVLKGKTRSRQARLFVVKDRVYQQTIVGPYYGKIEEEPARRFFNSLRLLDDPKAKVKE